ncbi:type II toxin-antitoxin system mRNA interferase toxin, RelE/StbE family [Helicobacter cynogastricus]|uniref:type II toxin-antitoxin system mRNA interferase toxin, RelE/StbE family n=1 Tax=Helicobacter cynogastricus TaxID=329937 RepID=UPI00131584BC|nr:type II toxin-antitoxin system mRNA interferase toxin, RelE/StbE family [Helicobacter cynogastricus]
MKKHNRRVFLELKKLCQMPSLFKRMLKNLNYQDLLKLVTTIKTILTEEQLSHSYLKHPLKSQASYIDCHVKPDLVLIYRHDHLGLLLVDLGKHNKIFK